MTNALSLLGILSLGLAWLVPAHFLPWMSWHSEVPAFFAVMLLAWCGWKKMQRSQTTTGIEVPYAVIPFAALAVVALVQRLSGQIPFSGDLWAIWLYLILCIVGVTFCGPALISPHDRCAADATEDRITTFALVLLTSAIAGTAVSLLQVFSIWNDSGWIVRMIDIRRPGGNLAQPNHLATTQAMAVASAMYLYSKNRLTFFSWFIITGYLVTGIAITESRTGALSVIGLSLWWLRLRSSSFSKAPIHAGLAWITALILVAAFVGWPKLMNGLLLTNEAANNLTSSSRFTVWPQLIAAVALHPWIGWGIGGVSKAHNAVASNYTESSPFTYSHNIFLDMILWLGIPIALMFFFALATWMKNRIAAANAPLRWYSLALLGALAIHSMFEYPFAYGYLLAPPMILLGLAQYGSNVKPLMRISSTAAAGFLLACSAMMALSTKEYLGLSEEFTQARFESARIGVVPPPSVEHHYVLLTQLIAVTRAARWTPERTITAEQLDLLRDVALQYPWVATQYRFAVALALSGDKMEAERQFKVMRAQHGALKFSAVKTAVHELAAEQLPELGQLDLPE